MGECSKCLVRSKSLSQAGVFYMAIALVMGGAILPLPLLSATPRNTPRLKEEALKAVIRSWLFATGEDRPSWRVDLIYAHLYHRVKHTLNPSSAPHSSFADLLPANAHYLSSGQQSDVYRIKPEQPSQQEFVRKLRRIGRQAAFQRAGEVAQLLRVKFNQPETPRLIKLDPEERYADFEWIEGETLGDCIRAGRCPDHVLYSYASTWSEVSKMVYQTDAVVLDVWNPENFVASAQAANRSSLILVDTSPVQLVFGYRPSKANELVLAWRSSALLPYDPCVRALSRVLKAVSL